MKFIQKIIEAIFGKKSDKDIKAVAPLITATKAEFEKLSGLSNDELRGKTQEFKGRIAEFLKEINDDIDSIKKEIQDAPDMHPEDKEELYKEIDKLEKERDKELEVILLELLPEAFAVVKETARRFKDKEELRATATQLDRDLAVNLPHMEIQGDQVIYQTTWMAAGGEISWNMVHYDVQLIGGVVLHKGNAAEMATGEGKTLVATLPAYLNGLAGLGVHIVTVNNYLALRDSEWMAPIFNFLGLTVDCIDKYRPNSTERREAYHQDIIYGTNNEFGFDYLRDNMVRNPDELVQQKHHFAMIDEVDSVLIDDARTPLIISGPIEKGDEHQYDYLKPRIERLFNVQKKLIRELLVSAKEQIKNGNDGEEEGGLALLRAYRGLPRSKPLIKYLSEPGIKNKLLATENFYMQEQGKRMPEVDEDLYFIIEEKQNVVQLTDKGVDLITQDDEDNSLFVMPDIGSAVADLEKSDLSEEEKQKQKDSLLQDFAIKSERLHSVQQLLKAYTLFEKDTEYVVMDGQVKIVDEGTGRIMEGRRYSDGLHQAIEAKESVKVEGATQTFATITLQNFFRMYHKLSGMTGTAETEAGEFWDIYDLDVVVIPTNKPIIRDDRDDLVYRTVREKFNAVIEEVVELSNAGRPVLVGTTSVDISEKLGRLLQMRGIKHNVLNAKNHAREAEIVAEAGNPGAVTIATNMAGRGTDIKLSDQVKEAGGLAIVGTERHDSRRVDRQLRGRAGRQGDPGSSQFYVSLEDNLMRIFGSDRIVKVMDRIGYEDGEVIQHKMISRSIENAQEKVEENNFGTRKRLLDYDEVMNAQRTVVYARRRHALFGERLTVDLHNSFQDLAFDVVEQHKQSSDNSHDAYNEFKLDVIRYFSVDTEITENEFGSKKIEDLAVTLYTEASEYYARKSEAVCDQAYNVIKRLYEGKGNSFERVIIPFVSGRAVVNVVANLEEAYNTRCRSLVKELEKMVSLSFLDDSWKEHLRQMDDLKQAVQNASYEQKDPLLIYKGEAYTLFKEMVMEMNQEVTAFLFRASLPVQDSEEVKEARQRRRTDMSQMQSNRSDDGSGDNKQKLSANRSGDDKPKTVKRNMPKVGRNDPCPCGSGKKFKQCHGRKQPV